MWYKPENKLLMSNIKYVKTFILLSNYVQGKMFKYIKDA